MQGSRSEYVENFLTKKGYFISVSLLYILRSHATLSFDIKSLFKISIRWNNSLL
jgi:hypothetical protein